MTPPAKPGLAPQPVHAMQPAAAATVAAPLDEAVTVGERTLRIRDLDARDRDAVLALHAAVFGSAVDGRWYHWKYGRDQGRGVAVGVWHGDELVAHCAGIPRQLVHRGRPCQGLQIGDVMVAPAWRGILTRRGPFFQACRRLYSSQLGADKAFQIGFGFPNERHLRLAVMLALSWHGGPVRALRWNVDAPALPRWRWQWAELDPGGGAWAARADAAWQAMRAACRDWTLGARDAHYLRWRYLARPDKRYRLFELRQRLCGPSGIAVLAAAPQAAEWLDWIGPPALLATAAQACRAEAARWQAVHLSAWVSPPVATLLAGSAPEADEIAAWVGIPCASALHQQEATALHFWFMGGDTDFL